MPITDASLDPRSYLDLKGRIIQRLLSEKVDQQILELIQAACEKGLKAEGIVLSRLEKKRLVLEMRKSLLTDLQ